MAIVRFCCRRLLKLRRWHCVVHLVGVFLLYAYGTGLIQYKTETVVCVTGVTVKECTSSSDCEALWSSLAVSAFLVPTETAVLRACVAKQISSEEIDTAAKNVSRMAIAKNVSEHKSPKPPVLPLEINMTAYDVAEKRLRDMKRKIKPGAFRIYTTGPSDGVRVPYNDLVSMQAERQARIRRTCNVKRLQDAGRNPLNQSAYADGWLKLKTKLRYSVEVYRPQHFVFCHVLKAGSTFFRRLLYALGNQKTIASPFDVPILAALKYRTSVLAEIAVTSDKRSRTDKRIEERQRREEEFLKNAGTVMFTRDPYTKLLSGYMDKLFSPNPYYWKQLGTVIIRRFRPNATSVSLRCGHDVTFPEFIKYVILNERTNTFHRNIHFVPSFDQCIPCSLNYDMIGKMETFPQDLSLLMGQLGQNLSQSTFKQWAQQSELDAILDSINSPYSWKKDILPCLSWQEANQRIWRKLKIRGLLDKEEKLPLSELDQHTVSDSSFIQFVTGYWERFRNTGRKSAQKKEALSSAYSLVPLEDLEQLRRYFLFDFDLFGYESRPARIFEASRTWDVFDVNN